MPEGYIVEKDTIVIQRDLTELDLFVKDFLNILKKHSNYLIVSGYVTISSGRSRATEDVDLLCPIESENKFIALFNDLIENRFWCYQGDAPEEIYKKYMKELTNIRFARNGEVFPNIEFIPITRLRTLKWFEFSNPQKVRVKDFEFKIPPLEFEILYKEIILGSDKDLKDAKHLRSMFSKILNIEKFKEYELLIKKHGENRLR